MIRTITLNPALDRELTVESITFDSVMRAIATRVDAGGKGINVSRMLRALGAETMALGFAGGATGRALADALHGQNIATAFVPVNGETRTNISIVQADHAHHIKVNEPGPDVDAHTQQTLIDKVAELARAGEWWVLSGSIPPGCDAEIYARLIRVIHHHGGRVALDSSGTALEAGVKAGPDLIKPNALELGALCNMPVQTPAQVAAALRTLAVNAVASMGRHGAVFLDGAQAWRVLPPPITEANPIGAGDAMLAGCVWALSNGQTLRNAMRWGTACGAAAAALPGTQMGTLSQVEAMAGTVQFQKVD